MVTVGATPSRDKRRDPVLVRTLLLFVQRKKVLLRSSHKNSAMAQGLGRGLEVRKNANWLLLQKNKRNSYHPHKQESSMRN